MIKQRIRKARARGVVAAMALAAMALHVVAVAEHHGHEHEEEEHEACPLCAAFSSEDDVALPQAAEGLAERRAERVAVASPTLLVARSPLPYSARGPPKLCR